MSVGRGSVLEELGRLASAYRQHIVTRKYPALSPSHPIPKQQIHPKLRFAPLSTFN